LKKLVEKPTTQQARSATNFEKELSVVFLNFKYNVISMREAKRMIKNILIFDDDKHTLSVCKYILESSGWAVFTRKNTNNLISALDETTPHVILMDNQIPETGGIIATQTIKAHEVYKNIPIIYFSASKDIQQLSLEAGADAYIEKPFDIFEFQKIISSVVLIQ
jgi:CheY-like chemotaxis protein